MWKIEKGKRIENVEDILYSANILNEFDNLIKAGVIPETSIFEYYNQIMNLEKEDRVDELENLGRQFSIQNLVYDKVISQKLAEEIVSKMKKGKILYKFDVEHETFECIIDEKVKKKSGCTDEVLLNEETVIALYRFAKQIPLDSYERYIFFMELLCFDNKDRAKEVNIAYNHFIVDALVRKDFLSEDEGEKIKKKIGKSQLLENWNNVLDERKYEEEFEDENNTENIY